MTDNDIKEIKGLLFWIAFAISIIAFCNYYSCIGCGKVMMTQVVEASQERPV